MADDVNLYSYVGNSPVMKVDLLGLFGTVDGDIESFLNWVYAGGWSISMNAMSQWLDQMVQEASSRIPCPVKQIVNWAFYWDYISNANWWNVVWQIAVWFTVAWIAWDIRDIKYQRDNWTGFDVMISSIGILPLVGDAVKLWSKSVRKADDIASVMSKVDDSVWVASKTDKKLLEESYEQAAIRMENAKLDYPWWENVFWMLDNKAKTIAEKVTQKYWYGECDKCANALKEAFDNAWIVSEKVKIETINAPFIVSDFFWTVWGGFGSKWAFHEWVLVWDTVIDNLNKTWMHVKDWLNDLWYYSYPSMFKLSNNLLNKF